VAVADATNLARTLGIVVALREFCIPMFLVMNMYDLASRRGLKADFRALEAELGIPVIPSIATSRDGIQGILGAIDRTLAAKDLHTQSPKAFPEQTSSVSVEALSNRQSEVDRILARVILKPASIDRVTYQIDRLVLHPWMGGVILLLILFSMFQMVFSLATVPMGWIEAGVEF
jgi:ferrous iron transport protein B